MKNVYLIVVVSLTVSFLLMPLLAVDKVDNIKKETSSKGTSSENKENQQTDGNFKIYLPGSKKVVTVTPEEYLIGVVAAEMPALYHEEALKAQAVAAFTYAYRKKLSIAEGEKYHLSADSTVDQGYITKAERKKKWGEKFSEYEAKIKKSVSAVKDLIIVYDNEPILAAYHAISYGNTEDAKNIWQKEYPYLKSVSSIGDLLAPEFLSEVKIPISEFKEKIKKMGVTTKEENGAAYIGKIEKSKAGTVLKIAIGDKTFTGAEIRNAFELRSSSFDLIFKDDIFIFSVVGYGHSVGMSQFGADYMAKQGSSYTEILKTYYTGVDIVKSTKIEK